MSDLKRGISRRRVIKTGMAGILATGVSPLIISKGAWAQEFCNNPETTGKAVFGFNVPLTGPYTEEGLDSLNGYQLAAHRAPFVLGIPCTSGSSAFACSS